ncbi:hypothetical protein, partial [Salmonella sp. gx-f7]|uniref:hypothetical protein n=1 Tax=Salmonella sp. gx-f7 TaxID=2582606 RepID=UPI001F39197B
EDRTVEGTFFHSTGQAKAVLSIFIARSADCDVIHQYHRTCDTPLSNVCPELSQRLKKGQKMADPSPNMFIFVHVP